MLRKKEKEKEKEMCLGGCKIVSCVYIGVWNCFGRK
jgi:hypothetical protein